MEPVQLLKTVLEELRQISTRLNDLSSTNTKTQERSYLSPEVKDIYAALAKSQAEMEYASRDSENPHWKSSYANLESVIRASRPYLAKNGICLSHRMEITKEGQTILVCTLGHISGQYIESIMRVIPDKNDIQAFGKYLTYIRRYSYIALCGLADTDDDGESAVAESRETAAKGTGLNTKYNPKDQSFETLTKEQVDEMEYELAEYPDLAEQILDGLRIQSIADIPKSKYRAAITRIREIKELRNNSPKKT
jgi:hypothetical protein